MSTFLDSGSFIFTPHPKVSKTLSTILPPFPSHNSKTRRRTPRKPLHLTMRSTPISSLQSFSHLDILSTIEFSDGTVMFQFGDATDFEESNSEQVGLVSEEVQKLNAAKVLDSNHDKDVVFKAIQRQLRNSALRPNVFDYVISVPEVDKIGETQFTISEGGQLSVVDSDSETDHPSESVVGLEEAVVMGGEELSVVDSDHPSGSVAGLEDYVDMQGGELSVVDSDSETDQPSGSVVGLEEAVVMEGGELSVSDSKTEYSSGSVAYLEGAVDMEAGELSVVDSDSETDHPSGYVVGLEETVDMEEGSVHEKNKDNSNENSVSVVEIEKGGDYEEVLDEKSDDKTLLQSVSLVQPESVLEVLNRDGHKESNQDNSDTHVSDSPIDDDDENNEIISENSVSVLDMENGGDDGEVLEESSVNETLLQKSDSVIEVPNSDGNKESNQDNADTKVLASKTNHPSSFVVGSEEAVDMGSVQEENDEILSENNVSVLDVENNADDEEVLEENRDNETLLQPDSVVESDSIIEVPNCDGHKDSSQDNADIQVSNARIDDKYLNVEAEMDYVIVEDSYESGLIIVPSANPLEVEPVLDDEKSDDTVEESTEPVKSQKVLNESSTYLVVEAENLEGEAQSSYLTDASGVGITDLKLTETAVSREEIATSAFYLSSGASLLPHPSKASAGGDDAYFVDMQNWLGVADGVGQWSLEGINPGVYARELMDNCKKIISSCTGAPLTNPVDVLKQSVENSQSSGSATVLIAYFDGQVLHAANIGDTGFIVIRNDAVYKRSSPMLHGFHFPLRIERGDDPSEIVEEYRFDLDEGDIIVVATNGLFDNLYVQEISSIVSKSLQDDIKLEEIAHDLAARAQEVGTSASARTPVADAAKAAGYVGCNGGKLDDVAVIVSLVMKRTNSP